ncbi:unnamed protein product [Cylindrotheca closterium]|uniref:C3H1-type domain-containing protein n=1 Tax=Cylindrotheca closterium TaxID=2856 RepID=A0AAD2JIM3_9STRA|nr:unnamed protein product [Cylindrotheca closterium]
MKRRREIEWRVYPPKKKPFAFSNGDDVLVKSKDGKTTYRGKIRLEDLLQAKQELKKAATDEEQLSNPGSKDQATNCDSKATPAVDGRSSFSPKSSSNVSVVLSKDQTVLQLSKKEQSRRLLPSFALQTPNIVVTPETNFFRILAKQVTAEDRVLEIGCSTGETSKLLVPPNSASWVGLDTSEQMMEQCKTTIGKKRWNEDTCHVTVVDALVDPIKAKQECTIHGAVTVVFIDIGGNRECIGVLRMLSWVLETFDQHLRLIVVKSRELAQSIQASASVGEGTGLVENGNEWFAKHRKKRAFPKHPLKAPMATSPKGMPICRYYNYHKEGCSKADCPYDHEYCHFCLKQGHIARNCPTLIDDDDTTVVLDSPEVVVEKETKKS